MHSYGHEWPCQVVYCPRYLLGAGLTDGESVERFWSLLRRIIGITRATTVRTHILQVLITIKCIYSEETTHTHH